MADKPSKGALDALWNDVLWFRVPSPQGRHEQTCEAVRTVLCEVVNYAKGETDTDTVTKALDRWKFLAGIPD